MTASALFPRYATTYAFSPDTRQLMPSLRDTRQLMPLLRVARHLMPTLRDLFIVFLKYTS